MKKEYTTILQNQLVLETLKQAWYESLSEPTGGHEEGGFILRSQTGELSVFRWGKGEQKSIRVPVHPNCRVEDKDIIASFHTHPNTGSEYLQEPSETDKRAVRNDPDLKGQFYIGEFVISQAKIYLIEPSGDVSVIGNTHDLFEKGEFERGKI